MKIRRGISGEVEKNVWVKFDIEFEEDDLVRFAVDKLGMSDTSVFTVKEAYIILNAEAEIYIAVEASKYSKDSDRIEKYRQEIAQHRKTQSDIVLQKTRQETDQS